LTGQLQALENREGEKVDRTGEIGHVSRQVLSSGQVGRSAALNVHNGDF
jgi:hypothetical protein